MDKPMNHIEEYKLLQKEIIYYIGANTRTEFYCAISVGAIYAYYLSQPSGKLPSTVKYIPLIIIALCALRCLSFVMHMFAISKYLRQIEEFAFTESNEPVGWHRYWKQKENRFLNFVGVYAGVLVWALAIVFCFLFSQSL
jgi:hypothetical protein